MYVIIPNEITPAEYLPFGNAYFPDYGWNYNHEIAQGILAWNIATAYALNAKVYSTTTNYVYLAVQAHTGQDPATDANNTYWVPMYKVNAWRAFDQSVGKPAYGYNNGGTAQTSTRTLVLAIRPTKRFDTICLLDVRARYVNIFYTDPDGILWQKDLLTVDTRQVVDAWTYFFGNAPSKRNIVFENVGGWYNAGMASNRGVIFIEILANIDDVSVGEVVIGTRYQLGKSMDGTSMRLIDYSAKEINAYGDVSIVPRPYSYQMNADFSIPIYNESQVLNLVGKDLRNVPAVYYPSENTLSAGVTVLGFPSDFRVTNRTEEIANATITIEGMT